MCTHSQASPIQDRQSKARFVHIMPNLTRQELHHERPYTSTRGRAQFMQMRPGSRSPVRESEHDNIVASCPNLLRLVNYLQTLPEQKLRLSKIEGRDHIRETPWASPFYFCCKSILSGKRYCLSNNGPVVINPSENAAINPPSVRAGPHRPCLRGKLDNSAHSPREPTQHVKR